MSLVHVGATVDLVWHILNFDLKAALCVLHHCLVFFSGHERDGQALGSKAASAAHTVQILVGVVGKVVVYYNVYALNVDSSAKDIGGHHDSLLEVLEKLEAFDSLVLWYTGVNAHRREG